MSNAPFIERSDHEKECLRFTSNRLDKWLDIASHKGYLTEADKKMTEVFRSLAVKHLPNIKMQFMHGHFSSYDIYKLSDKEYVLMSNLFWSWHP